MTNAGGAPHGSLWYLAFYAGISATQIVFQLSSTLLLKILSLAAARTMHNDMLKSLLRWVCAATCFLFFSNSWSHVHAVLIIEPLN